MKEIDFIPEWYKTSRKRIVGYHRQYALTALLFVTLLAWSHAAGRFVSKAKADISRIRNLLEIKEPLEEVYSRMKENVDGLKENLHVLRRVEPRINLSHVIGELSYLVDDRVVLSRIEIHNEALRPAPRAAKKGVVTITAGHNGKSSVLPEPNIRSKVTIAGIAAEASDVASLISKLEQSPYFCRIIPEYSRSRDIKGATVVEFEIGCYVANYVQQTQSASE